MGFLDDLSTGAGILGGVGNFIGSLFGNGRPSLSAQLDVSKQMAKYQHDLNMDAWREQNAYNDPSAQMERLKNAGINPHSIAGNASVAGNASGVPSTQVDTPDISNFQRKIDFGSLSSMAQLISNLKNVQTDTDKKETEVEINKTTKQNLDVQRDLAKEEILNRQLSREQTRLMMAVERMRMWRDNEMFKYDTKFRDAQIQKEFANIDQINASIRQINQTIKESDSRIRNLNSQSQNNEATYEHWLSRGVQPGGSWQTRLMDYFGDSLDSTLGKLDTTISQKVKDVLAYFDEGGQGSGTPVGKAYKYTKNYMFNKKRKKYTYNKNHIMTPYYGHPNMNK